MEEEGGDDSEMIDAMDGWDSDQDDGAAAGDNAAEAKWSSIKYIFSILNLDFY